MQGQMGYPDQLQPLVPSIWWFETLSCKGRFAFNGPGIVKREEMMILEYFYLFI